MFSFLISTLIAVNLISSNILAGNSSKGDSVITITISAVGDLMCHSDQFKSARTNEGHYDFDPAFRFVKKYFINSDFVFGNLETVTAGKSAGFSGYPLFNTPDEYISALKNAGFDLLTPSNNHSLDRGEKGILRTLKEIKENNIISTGTFCSYSDRDSIRIANIKGIKAAFLAYSYGTNGISIPQGKNYLINIIDTSLIKNDIKRAHENGAEIVIVYFHFGTEYQHLPNSFQKEIVTKTVDAGADIIIGGHPHVLQPLKYFKSKNIKIDSGLVIYSMGNLLSGQRQRFRNSGIILRITIQKNFNSGEIKLKNTSYVPTFVYKGKYINGNGYIILPSIEAITDPYFNFLGETVLDKIKTSLADTKTILGKYNTNIQVFDYEKDLVKQIKMLAVPSNVYMPQLFLRRQGE